MKANEIIYARTHAALLNQVLNKNYKQYMKSSIKLPDGKLLWMIELSPYESSSHWINQLLNDEKISEKHVGKVYEHEGHGTYLDSLKRRIYWDDSDRVVFQKVEFPNRGRKYIFRGVFRLNKKACTLNENVWERVSDHYDF